MIWLFATFTSAFIFGIGSFLLKLGSHKNYPEASMLLGLYVAGSSIFLVAILVNGNMSFNDISFNWLILAFAILVGLGSYYGNSFLVKAYDLGPACLTAPLMSMSVLFVILLSAFFYHESITSKQHWGIICMVLAASLLGCTFNSMLIKSRMWIVFVILGIVFLFLREGGLKIAYETGLNNMVVLFFSYFFAIILSSISLLRFRKNSATKMTEVQFNHTPAFLLGSLTGICSGIGMGLLAYAMTMGPASIIVPIFSTRSIVTVLLIMMVFKEKLRLLQWLAVGLMILGIGFIS